MNFNILDKYRETNGPWATSLRDSKGLFFIPTTKSQSPLMVLSSGYHNTEWFHVSVSLGDRCPTWKEMCMIKELFYEDMVAVQYHPNKANYINNHPFCLHLWANMEKEIELPPSILVGVK